MECLSGSAAIASAYARAFDDGLTITLVSGRTVGIGAYLARLGRRHAAPTSPPLPRLSVVHIESSAQALLHSGIAG